MFPVLGQADMLARVIERAAPGTGPHQFIGTAVANRTQRRAWTAALKQSDLSRVPPL